MGNAKGDKNGHMHGFQLWANLPSAEKMTTPRYQDINQEIRVLEEDDGSKIKVIAEIIKVLKGR